MQTIWQIAKSIEIEGMKMYESLALSSPGNELTGVFSMLAEDERRHYELFNEMEKKGSIEASQFLTHENTSIKDIFERLSAGFVDNDEAMKAMLDAESGYIKAISMENRSVEYYQDLIAQIENVSQKAAISQIIMEEKRHAKIIEGLINFVHKPKEWLENAEVNHLDEY